MGRIIEMSRIPSSIITYLPSLKYFTLIGEEVVGIQLLTPYPYQNCVCADDLLHN